MENTILKIYMSKFQLRNRERPPKVYFSNYFKKYVLDTGFDISFRFTKIDELKQFVLSTDFSFLYDEINSSRYLIDGGIV
jgi:hypothetical protein